ncbi:MAG TPA: parallel beta-helix domain-containing protein [Anaerolineales bacterium]|nr:parallel beta-helix domain-containing protein [Anaerolineales bacterium]
MKKILRILGLLVALAGLVLLSLGFFPAAFDEKFAPEDYGVGASSVIPSTSGLLREFPVIRGETSPAQAELGRQLFFDPVLSEKNDLSCAHCHHPDFGFADSLRIAIGAGGSGAGPERSGGVTLLRSTPGLWNVGYAQFLFWDGRETRLEDQVHIPLLQSDEMGATDPTLLAAELAAIPSYGPLFSAAFGDDDITFDRITIALAAFQRTLISRDSPFDRYAAGAFDSLTASQRRGLNLFRSAALRCFECHQNPTFASDTLRVVGVPSMLPDLGAGNDNFKVPSLRNIALTAPYMHNGAFDTLEEVVEFYSKGGGIRNGFDNIDPFVQGFELTDQEVTDLVAFLYALTDESGLPNIPTAVPSGLPVVPRMDNPARTLVAQINVAGGGAPEPAGAPRVIRVEAGETIQSAVDRAKPGDVIEIPYGVYHETVVVDISDLTLRGIPNEAGEYPHFDGENERVDGVISSGNNFEISHLRFSDYRSNAVIVEGVTGVYMHHIIAENTGVYGLYPVQCTDVLIEHSVVSGVNDAGIYAGQSERVVIRYNEVFGNVLGIEAENTVDVEIYGNRAHGNTLGILVVLLPNLTSKVSLDTRVYDNVVEDNNLSNFARAGTAAALVPAGSGIAVIGSDGTEIFDNTITGNKTAGIGVFHLNVAYSPEEINVPATPEGNWVHDNVFENNGFDADAFVTDLGIPGADILWDVSGAGNRFDQPGVSTFPPALPTSRWPAFLYNLYWQLLNILIGLL